MLTAEKRYDFKKELLQVHKKDWRDYRKQPTENEYVIPDGVAIVLPESSDDVVYTAAKDFADYLLVSMNVPAMIAKAMPSGAAIKLFFNKDIGEAAGYMGYRITVGDDGITVEGYDNVGIAQGLYFLEDLMNIRRAPFLEKKITSKKSLFEVRVAQSPFGMFEYTDECLAYMAHRGYNRISLWIKGLNKSKRGDYIDMPLLCERAEKYGIGVNVQIYAEHSVHPDEPGAQEFYDNLYGEVFGACPKIKGYEFVGETSHFSSRDPDPHVGLAPLSANYIDNIPTGKVSPGFWPCNDYPKLLEMIKKAIHKHSPDAEIYLSTYNWSWVEEEKRLELINAIPTDITLLLAWVMCEKYKMNNSYGAVVDYSLRNTEAGKYFSTEAAAARARGIKVMVYSNTAGRTWDFGVIPYEPMPYKWIELFENIIKADKELGFSEMGECIHYGFHPSFIGDLEKWAFFTHEEDLRDVLSKILARDFGEENLEEVDAAMRLWSEAIGHYPCSNENQYGAFRIGPSFPLWVVDPRSSTMPQPEQGKIPKENDAMFGNGIYFPTYTPDYGFNRINSLPGVRVFDEIKEIEEMKELFLAGINKLKEIENPNDALLKLINMGEFIYRSCITGLNAAKLYVLSQNLNVCGNGEKALVIIDEMEALLLKEKENVEKTIPIVQLDSRLGWEPSMEYMGDEKCLRWKLRQLEYELNYTLPTNRKCCIENGVKKR